MLFRKKTKTAKVIISVILLGLLIFLGNTTLLVRSRSVFFTATSAVRTSLFYFTNELSARLKAIFRRSESIIEAEKLRTENQNLSSKLATFSLLEEENRNLRQVLKIKQENGKESLIAQVTGFQRQFRNEFLIIDVGSKDGVSIGDLAVAESNIFIGRIKEVWSKNSRLILSSSAGENYASVLLPQNLPVLARGNNNQEMMLDLVPENTEVRNGDIAASSGKGDIFIEGLFLGTVVSAKKLDNQIFQSVLIKTAYDPNFLKKIVIIKK